MHDENLEGANQETAMSTKSRRKSISNQNVMHNLRMHGSDILVTRQLKVTDLQLSHIILYEFADTLKRSFFTFSMKLTSAANLGNLS